MSKTNVFALFGIFFLSSVLLGNGMYSGQVYAIENQNQTEKEAEIEAYIEQENKCKKDTQCENENELNNQLDITTTTGQQQDTSLTVKKEIFGCNNINDGEMNCFQIQNDSPEWISCADSAISDSEACQNIEEGFFDIEVLDGHNTQVQQFTGSTQGTTIKGIEQGTYAINEIIHPIINDIPLDQLNEGTGTSDYCKNRGFADGGNMDTALSYYVICFEYEDEQGNDCSQTTVNEGEDRVCTVKNYIVYSDND